MFYIPNPLTHRRPYYVCHSIQSPMRYLTAPTYIYLPIYLSPSRRQSSSNLAEVWVSVSYNQMQIAGMITGLAPTYLPTYQR